MRTRADAYAALFHDVSVQRNLIWNGAITKLTDARTRTLAHHDAFRRPTEIARVD